MADLNGEEPNTSITEINYENLNVNDTVVMENLSESIVNEIPARRISTKEIGESLIVPESDLKKHKVNSLSRLVETDKNPIIIPKENLNSFFNRLASVSKFNSQKTRESNVSNELIKENETTAVNSIPVMKHFDLTHKKSTKRDTQMLDARFNVNEILNDQNKLLLTEENILEKSLDSSKENNVLNNDIKENRHNLSFSMDENIDINFVENNLRNDLRLSGGFDTFDKNSKKPVTARIISTNVKNNNPLNYNKINKIAPIKEVNKQSLVTSRNTKNAIQGKFNITPKSLNLQDKKISALNSLDSSINTTTKSTLNSFSMMSGKQNLAKSKSPTFTKQNLSPSFKDSKGLSTTRPSLSPNFKKQDLLNKNKNVSVSPMNSSIKSKIPVNFHNKINPPLNQSNVSYQKNTAISKFNSKIPETKRNNKNNNTIIPNRSKKDVLNTSSSAYSRINTESTKNLSKSFHARRSSQGVTDRKTSLLNGNSEFNVIEEYDYSKILSELRAIFGEDLEFFDESSMI